MKQSGIYQFLNTKTNIPYIGSAFDIKARLKTLKENPEIMQDMIKKRKQTYLDNPVIMQQKIKTLRQTHYNNPKIRQQQDEKRRKLVIQLDKDYNYIAEFLSLRHACIALGKSVKRASDICCSCTGRQGLAFGFRWMYLENYCNFIMKAA